MKVLTDYYKMASKETGTLTESREMKLQAWIIVLLTVLIAGCASSSNNAKFSTNQQNTLNNPNNIESDPNSLDEAFTDEDFEFLEDELDEQMVDVPDPLEPFNRLMFGVNDVLYFWAAKPCAQVYEAVVPEPARTGVRNFFHNLTTPVRYVNCLLQGKGDSADTELRRFVTNTTIGVLGFGDPARDQYGLQPVQEDLGQTLAVHGMDQGFYIVWPFFGPSNVRDSIGKVGDMFLNPVRYVEPRETSIYISAGKGVNEGSFHIGEYEDFKSAALEPYVAMREAYIQYRNKKIQE